jgi:ubiquitin-like 1-activating enzyme E1 A
MSDSTPSEPAPEPPTEVQNTATTSLPSTQQQNPEASSEQSHDPQPPEIPISSSTDNVTESTLNHNGTAEMLQMDPAALMNGYPVDIQVDPNFIAAPIDPLQAGMMTLPTIQPLQPLEPISADEIALYDRQIRLWGVQAQEKIRSANILLIGLKGLGTEVAKNLVLAGVGTLTILEHDVVTEEDLGSQFFITQDHVGQNRANAAQPELQKLNPRVNLFVDPDIVYTKFPEYFSSFDITIATALPFEALQSINMSCRNFGRKFYAADTHGVFGYIFSDLVLHTFAIERQQSNKSTKPGDIENGTRSVLNVSPKIENGKAMEVVTKQELFSPLLLVNSSPLPAEAVKTAAKKRRVSPLLSCIRAIFEFQREAGGRLPGHNAADIQHFTRLVNQKHTELQLPRETIRSEFLRAFLQNIGTEISPTVAFLGGNLAQDVINVLGQREQPLQNFLLFDGEQFQSSVFSIHPVFDESMVAGMDMALPVEMNGTAGIPGMEMNGSMTVA